MKLPWFRMIVLGCFVSLLAACGYAVPPDFAPEAQPSITVPAPSHETPTEPKKDKTQMSQSTPSFGMDALITRAKGDLAQRLSVELTQISLVEAKAIVWPDASLGCPQPGMAYKQVPQDGALIHLEVNGREYEYHSGGSRDVFLCEKFKKDSAKPPKLDITDRTPPEPD